MSEEGRGKGGREGGVRWREGEGREEGRGGVERMLS